MLNLGSGAVPNQAQREKDPEHKDGAECFDQSAAPMIARVCML